ncbi:unnamed protein product [Aureobasidium pullulans]|nr:unnamed protein product [Aureobasidium pullulans]
MRKKPAVLADFITQDDWVILTQYYEILEPVWQFTQRLEGRGSGASHGVVWQVIPAMERLFLHFEKLKAQYVITEPAQNYAAIPLLTSNTPASQSMVVASHHSQSQPSQLSQSYNVDLDEDMPISRPIRKAVRTAKNRRNQPAAAPPMSLPAPPPPPPLNLVAQTEQTSEYRMLATGINLAWKKLNEYYHLTDRSPVYVAAVVLHPAYTWKWFRSKWRTRQEWIQAAEVAVRQFWLLHYAQLPLEILTDDEEEERST